MEYNKKFLILIFVFIIFAAIILLSIICERKLASDSKVLVGYISDAETSILTGEWNDAEANINDAEVFWQETQKTWSIIIDHFEIDNIESTLIKMREYMALHSKDLTLGELSLLKMYIKHIPDREMPTIQNIF